MSDNTKPEVSETAPKKSSQGVSARLLQNTTASSARSTPTLTRKFGSQKNKENNSARKVMTSSAKKKSVFNSTSESDNVVPTDWDASAIAAPPQDKSNVINPGGRRKLHEPMTDMKIKAGIKQNPVRGPLKAMPQTAIKPTRERDPPMTATKSVFKRLQPSNTSSSSNTSMVEDEGMALYDEYLLSKLMLLNVQQNCREAKKAANKDVLNMLTAIEDIRSEVVAQEKANEELKVLRKFHKEASENQTNMKSAIENMKMLKKEATIVAEALENTMHQLPVHGAKADVKNLECILTENVKTLSQNKPSVTDENEKKELIQRLEKLHKNLDISKSTFDKCQESLKSLRTETLREKSVQISKIQTEETVDIDEMINSVMPFPSDPKLIDI